MVASKITFIRLSYSLRLSGLLAWICLFAVSTSVGDEPVSLASPPRIAVHQDSFLSLFAAKSSVRTVDFVVSAKEVFGATAVCLSGEILQREIGGLSEDAAKQTLSLIREQSSKTGIIIARMDVPDAVPLGEVEKWVGWSKLLACKCLCIGIDSTTDNQALTIALKKLTLSAAKHEQESSGVCIVIRNGQGRSNDALWLNTVCRQVRKDLGGDAQYLGVCLDLASLNYSPRNAIWQVSTKNEKLLRSVTEEFLLEQDEPAEMPRIRNGAPTDANASRNGAAATVNKQSAPKDQPSTSGSKATVVAEASSDKSGDPKSKGDSSKLSTATPAVGKDQPAKVEKQVEKQVEKRDGEQSPINSQMLYGLTFKITGLDASGDDTNYRYRAFLQDKFLKKAGMAKGDVTMLFSRGLATQEEIAKVSSLLEEFGAAGRIALVNETSKPPVSDDKGKDTNTKKSNTPETVAPGSPNADSKLKKDSKEPGSAGDNTNLVVPPTNKESPKSDKGPLNPPKL